MSIFETYRDKLFKSEDNTYLKVFEQFDSNRDGLLDVKEFTVLLQQLFTESSLQEQLSTLDVSDIFAALDIDNDQKITRDKFRYAWNYWFRQILKPVKALIIVDVQNDFITGSLSLASCPAGQDGAAVVPIINSLLDQDLFDVVVYTYDWHPLTHISFIDNVKLRKFHPSSPVNVEQAKGQDKVVFSMDSGPREQVMWPKHCVQESQGAQLHPDLKVVENAFHVNKGMNPDVDSYSAFWDNDKLSRTELSEILRKHLVTDVYVCGLAYDVCVGFTATHAVEHGFRTVLIEDASRGVTLDGISNMRDSLSSMGVLISNSSEVPGLTRSEIRPLCLGRQATVNYKLAWKIVTNKYKNTE